MPSARACLLRLRASPKVVSTIFWSSATYQILHCIEGLGEIAEWAAFHQGNIKGDGYPFNRHGDEIVLEARILAAADVFQAQAQDRPAPTARPCRRNGSVN